MNMKNLPVEVNLEMFVDHPMFHHTDKETSRRFDQCFKNRIYYRISCDFVSLEDTLEDDVQYKYGLLDRLEDFNEDYDTLRNFYYKYVIQTSEGDVIARFNSNLTLVNNLNNSDKHRFIKKLLSKKVDEMNEGTDCDSEYAVYYVVTEKYNDDVYYDTLYEDEVDVFEYFWSLITDLVYYQLDSRR